MKTKENGLMLHFGEGFPDPQLSGFDLYLTSAIAVTQQEKFGTNLKEKWISSDTPYITEIEKCV